MVAMNSTDNLNLGKDEQLKLLQLQQLHDWTSRHPSPDIEPNSADKLNLAQTIPDRWSLLSGVQLYDWQQSAVQQWFAEGNRGIIKVVTGAGKTMLALAAAERLQGVHRDLRIAIVVPTIVLLEQWREEISARSNLPASAIGVLGGGGNDQFDASHRILICVLNSASRKLPEQVRRLRLGERLLLIVDECHRAGATEMQKLFDVPRAFTLGLSATPERDDETDIDEEDSVRSEGEADQSVLEREIGPIVYEMTYAEAIGAGVLAPFGIEHYALSLSATERAKYTAISQEITDLRRELETGSRRGLALIRWCRSANGSKNPKARRLIGLISERKRLLYSSEQRFKAVDRLIHDAIVADANSRIIIFHESIAEVMALFARLRRLGYAVVAEHSEFPDRIRAQAISLFRQGIAQIIVSARSLIEGFNVPSADIGIIVAASSSVRQRIQTLGRLLRRSSDATADKKARLIVLFAADTVDEMIYEKADWHAFVGAERNEYFQWRDVESSEPESVSSAPRMYIPLDFELDPELLSPGNKYLGRLDGEIYSIDTTGTVFDGNRQPVIVDSDLSTKLSDFQVGGRFLVTPKRFHLVKLMGQADAVYLGQLKELPQRGSSPAAPPITDDLHVGSDYPINLAHGKTYSVLQRDKRLIAKKQRGRVSFVRSVDKEADPLKHSRLENIQQALLSVYQSGRQISKIFVNDLGHVGYLYQGQAYFVGIAPEGNAGFVLDD
jgi:superfamily II DNA or RNA helicase